MELAQRYQQKERVKDARFSVDEFHDYSLNILLSDIDCSVAVIDARESRCLYAEKFEFDKTFSSKQLITTIESIYDEHHFLKAGYWKDISVCVKNDKFSLIPTSLFDQDSLRFYLDLNCEFNDSEEDSYHYNHKNIGATNVFAIDKKIKQWFGNAYPHREVKFLHQTSSFIEGISRAYTDDGKYLSVLCDHSSLNIALIENKKLVYCNVFNYNTPEDLLYFVMYIIKELDVNPDKIPVTLWGTFDQGSIYFAKLYKYIRYLKLGHRPETLTFGFVFDEIFEHSLFDLLNMHLCE